MKKAIYLDNNATTPLDPRVLDAMLPFLQNFFGNAASTHKFGRIAYEAIERARVEIADLIHADSKEIVFTSGASEGVNLAMKGVFEKNKEGKNHLITVKTEHSAVLDTAKYLQEQGIEVTFLPVESSGLINIEDLKEALSSNTALVSVMYVNNETGVIQPIQEIAKLSHEAGALFMTDGTQAVGKMPVDVQALGIDLMPFSAHKFYGPKGVGALYVRSRGKPRFRIGAIQHGGGHERGMRSGTLNVPGIVGLGKASAIAKQEMEADSQRIGKLRNKLEKELLTIPNSYINGDPAQRLYNVTNIRFEGADADAVMIALDHVAVSNGSACTSISVDPSHVLRAMGLTELEAFSSIRFSLGRFTTEQDIDGASKAMHQVISQLRKMTQN